MRVLLLSLDCFTLPLILTLYSWVLSNVASNTIFWVCGMIEPKSLGPMANTQTLMPMSGRYILYRPIDIAVRLFANNPGDWGPIPGRVIPKTQKMVLDAYLLCTWHYKVRIKSKWNNPGKGVTASLTPWCGSHWKVAIDYGRAANLYIYIYIYIYIRSYVWVCACSSVFKLIRKYHALA